MERWIDFGKKATQVNILIIFEENCKILITE
jgi:hypothetical protein